MSVTPDDLDREVFLASKGIFPDSLGKVMVELARCDTLDAIAAIGLPRTLAIIADADGDVLYAAECIERAANL